MPVFHLQQRKPIQRGSIEHGTAPVLEWRPLAGLGEHPTRLAAMRHYVEQMDPDFQGAPDRLIRAQWRAWACSSGLRTAAGPLVPELEAIRHRRRRCPPLGGEGRRGGRAKRRNAARVANQARVIYRVQEQLHRIGQLTPEVVRRGAPVLAKRFQERQPGPCQLALF